MSDPSLDVGRLVMLAFVPITLLLPLAIAFWWPSRVAEGLERRAIRGRLVVLAVATLVALSIWLGLLLAGPRFPWAPWLAGSAWTLFIPLWAVFAMPVLRLKNPALDGDSPSHAGIRTASLMNRERQSPVTPWMWAVAAICCLAGPVTVAARGLWPFAGDAALDAIDRTQWLIFLGATLLGPLELLVLPMILRATLVAPEPMDAAGSPELAAMYARERRRRVLGLFWLVGTAGPAFLGILFAFVTWFPQVGGTWGLIGGVGGTLIGVLGAIFGISMSVERARIAEFRARPGQAAAGSGR